MKLQDFRMLRGGGWTTAAEGCRVAYRSYDWSEYRSFSIGFRVVF